MNATENEKLARLVMELRGEGVTDTRVLGAIERVPRELFVPPTFQEQAYDNVALPIGHGQTISQPLVVALMTQALDVSERHKVLEIGTGSGYQAAVLARLCRRVFTDRAPSRPADARPRSALPSCGSTTSRRASATAPRAGRSRRRSTASSSPPPRPTCPAICSRASRRRHPGGAGRRRAARPAAAARAPQRRRLRHRRARAGALRAAGRGPAARSPAASCAAMSAGATVMDGRVRWPAPSAMSIKNMRRPRS